MGGLGPLADTGMGSDTMEGEKENEGWGGIDMRMHEAKRLRTRDFHREDTPVLHLLITATRPRPDLPRTQGAVDMR